MVDSGDYAVTENPLREVFSEIGIKRRQALAMLRHLVLSEVLGGLWHTTHPERFRGILASKAILFDPPDNPNPDGWKTISGELYCSYARKLGGISLFDFAGFDYLRVTPRSLSHVFMADIRSVPSKVGKCGVD